MYKARLNELGVMFEFSNEAYNLLQTKEVTDGNTGEHLYNAKIVCVEDGVLLVIKETKFEIIAETGIQEAKCTSKLNYQKSKRIK